jgi:nucleoside-diphosphate-sugar epimerase
VHADRYGEPSDKVFNDLEGVDELTHLPDHAQHRHVDAIVLAAAERHGDSVKVAIVCPPCIYGPGRGPVNGRSRQIYNLARTALINQKVYVFGRGLARWNFTHIHDVSCLFALLADAAAINNANAELWGPRSGYFLVDSGTIEEDQHAWGDVARWVADAAVARVYMAKVETMPVPDKETAIGVHGLSWGTNARGQAGRARKFLGWRPAGRGVREEIPDIVESEYQLLKRGGTI